MSYSSGGRYRTVAGTDKGRNVHEGGWIEGEVGD